MYTSYTSPKMVKNRPETTGSQGKEGRKTVNRSFSVFFLNFGWVIACAHVFLDIYLWKQHNKPSLGSFQNPVFVARVSATVQGPCRGIPLTVALLLDVWPLQLGSSSQYPLNIQYNATHLLLCSALRSLLRSPTKRLGKRLGFRALLFRDTLIVGI